MEKTNFQYTWEQAVNWLRNQPEHTELVRNAYLDENPLHACHRFIKSEEWEEISGILRSLSIRGGKGLDVGGGNGISTYALAKSGYEVKVIEPDPSDSVGRGAIQTINQSENLGIEIFDSFGEKLPFSDNDFNLVYGRQVLHHAQDLKEICREVYRVLKPGGAFIATREHVISKPADLQRFLDSHPLHFLYGGENALILSKYKSALKEAGFNISITLGPFDSVINYSPMTKEGFALKRKEITMRVFGRRFGAFISRQTPYITLFPKVCSFLTNEPGRLYSFVCRKI